MPETDGEASDRGPLHGVARYAAWTYVGLIATALLGFVTTAYEVRAVGQSAYGVYALVLTLATLFTTLNVGLSLAVARATALQRTADDTVLTAARRTIAVANTAYQAIGAATVAIAIVAARCYFSLAAHSSPRTAILIELVGLAIGVMIATSAVAGVTIGLRKFRRLAITNILNYVIQLAVIIIFARRIGLASLGWALLAGIAVSRCCLAIQLVRSEPWFRLRSTRVRAEEVTRVTSFAVPLVLMSVADQLITATDLATVGSVASSSAVTQYRIGSSIPSQAIYMLYTGVDTVFPALVQEDSVAVGLKATAFLTRLASFTAAVGFTTLVLNRSLFVRTVIGARSSLADTVLLLFCLIWIVNIAAHGIALVLIANDLHRVLTPILIGEAVANIVLTIAFGLLFGTLGPAIATLVVVTVSNNLVLPMALKRVAPTARVGQLLARSVLLPSALGLLVAIPTWVVATRLLGGGISGAIADIVGTALVAFAVGVLAIGADGRQQLRTMLHAGDGSN